MVHSSSFKNSSTIGRSASAQSKFNNSDLSGAGVNIKIPIKEHDDEDLYLSVLNKDGEVSRRVIRKDELPEMVIKLKDGYHTFLCFKSGSCIHSGRGKCMIETFNKFLEILKEHKEELEDK